MTGPSPSDVSEPVVHLNCQRETLGSSHFLRAQPESCVAVMSRDPVSPISAQDSSEEAADTEQAPSY